MAYTLSGKIEALNYVDMASRQSLYRYIGIIDQVTYVENNDSDLTADMSIFYYISHGEKILFTNQNNIAENGVYQMIDGVLKKVTYENLELGCLVESLSESTQTESVFYQLGADDTWTAITLKDGVTAP